MLKSCSLLTFKSLLSSAKLKIFLNLSFTMVAENFSKFLTVFV